MVTNLLLCPFLCYSEKQTKILKKKHCLKLLTAKSVYMLDSKATFLKLELLD